MKKTLLLSFALSASIMMLASSAKFLDANRVHSPADSIIELIRPPESVVSTLKIAERVANPNRPKMTKKLSTSIRTKAEGDMPLAYYSRPQGFFYWGIGRDNNRFYNVALLGAAYSKATWRNFSTDATSYKWSYADPTDMTGKTFSESTDKDLTLYYTQHQATTPTLAATSGVGNNTFQIQDDIGMPGIYLAGGEATSYNETSFGVSSKDFSSGATAYYEAGTVGNWWFGTGSRSNDRGIIGMGLYMEQPVHPYVLKSVYAIARNFNASPDIKFSITVYKVDSNGELSEVIAKGSCLAFDAKVLYQDPLGGSFVTLPFTLVKEKTSGSVENVIPTIDSPIFVELTGYQAAKSMTLLVAEDNMPNPYGESGYFIIDNYQGRYVEPLSTYFKGEPLHSAPSIFLDIAYTWFETDEDTFVAPLAGGSKTFDVNAYYYSPTWIVNEELKGTLPDWINYSTEDDTQNKTSKLTFNVEPLPSGVEGRSFDVTVSIPGTTKVFKISQGSSGVNDAVVNSIKVTNVGGDFAVSYPATVSAVKIYNVSGQLVKDVALTEAGSSVIPAQELAKGVYIMQFNDNQSVKVIK